MRVEIYSSIHEVPETCWDTLTSSSSTTVSRAFWQMIEQCRLNDFKWQHALFFDSNNTAVALTSFYTITTDLAIFAPSGLRAVLDALRRAFPNFLKARILECGSPININAPLTIAQGQDPKPIVNALCQLMRKQARHEKAFMVVIRDFQPESSELLSAFQSAGYCAVGSLPNTHMKVVWNSIDDYHAGMKSYFRSKLLKHLRKNRENGISHRVTEDFGDIADILCAQWLTVHNQADELKREVLTPEFFRGFASLPGKCAKAILYYRSNELVGHALLLADGDLLRWMYIGRKNAGNDSLYFYIGNSVIETAILLGLTKIEMGVTTYSIKRDLGAAVTPVRMALRAPNALINPFVRYIYPIINRLPTFSSKEVFKKNDQ